MSARQKLLPQYHKDGYLLSENFLFPVMERLLPLMILRSINRWFSFLEV